MIKPQIPSYLWESCSWCHSIAVGLVVAPQLECQGSLGLETSLKWKSQVKLVCLLINANMHCFSFVNTAVPDPPSLSIHYNNATEDYVFNIVAPYDGNEYLKDKLTHQAVVRKRGAEWPVSRVIQILNCTVESRVLEH